MAKILSFFQEFIHFELPRLARERQDYIAGYDQKLAALRAEAEVYRFNFRQQFFVSKEEELQYFIDQQQLGLTMLADELLRFLDKRQLVKTKTITDAPSLTNLCKETYLLLEFLLKHIETYFSGFFDKGAPPPVIYRVIKLQALRPKMKRLFTQLEATPTDPELVNCVLSEMKTFVDTSPEHPISYRELSYFEKLVEKMVELVETNPGEDLTQRLMDLLIGHNFNSPAFMQVSVTSCEERLQRAETLEEQLLEVEQLLKWAMHLPMQHAVRLNPENMATKEAIVSWLKSGHRVLSTKITLAKEKAETRPEGLKVRTTLTVAMLGHLIKLMLEQKVIEETNVTKMAEFFATHFMAKHGSISAENLRQQITQASHTAVESTRELLYQLIKASKGMQA